MLIRPFVLCTFLLALLAGAADAKEYSADRFDSRIEVLRGGMLRVTETVRLRFIDGTFTQFTREIPRRMTDGIEIVSTSMDEGVLTALQQYDWPGNVRELENTLTRAVVLAKGDVLDETQLPQSVAAGTAHDVDAEGELPTLREIERRHIARVLVHTEWNKRRACAVLDISRPTLDRKIEEYGLRKDEP